MTKTMQFIFGDQQMYMDHIWHMNYVLIIYEPYVYHIQVIFDEIIIYIYI
jgi:hypothetical protein